LSLACLTDPAIQVSTAIRLSGGSQFTLSGHSLIRFIRRFDPITRFWQKTHNRKLKVAGTGAERRTKIPYRLTEAKFVRHRVIHLDWLVNEKGDRAARSGYRQVETRKWDVLARGVHI
jgi:hypothetical protein